MIRVEVKLDDAGARKAVAAVRQSAEHREPLHQAMAAGVEEAVREHLLGINSRSPHTGFYARAARSTESVASEAGALVRIPHRGMALRYYGGKVTPGKSVSSKTGKPTKALAIPTEHVPLAGTEGRKGPREVGPLAFLRARAGAAAGTIGYLVQGQPKIISGGSRDGMEIMEPLPGGKLMFVLRSWTDHDPDPTVLPSEAELTAAATAGARSYLAAVIALRNT